LIAPSFGFLLSPFARVLLLFLLELLLPYAFATTSTIALFVLIPFELTMFLLGDPSAIYYCVISDIVLSDASFPNDLVYYEGATL